MEGGEVIECGLMVMIIVVMIMVVAMVVVRKR